MNCHKVQNLISAYVDSELPGVEMLAIRQHLNECRECNSEFETLLRIKRAFGKLLPKHPAENLADRICRQLDQVPLPAHEQFLATLRKHLTLFPGRLRLAASGVGLVAILFMLRAGSITTNYTYIPEHRLHAGIPAGDTARLFSVTPLAEAGHIYITPPKQPAGPWGLSEESKEPVAPISNANLLLVSY